MWTPYFCIIWSCPYSEIQWYILHNRLERLDFSFGHSVFSLLMVHSNGGSLSILISSGMKATSKFPRLLLKVRPYSAVSFHFRKFAFLVYFDAQIEAVDCEILFAKIRGRQTNFSRPFQPCFQIFHERGKVYPNKSYLKKRCFGTLLYSFMFDFASKEGGRGGWGEHWWNWVLIKHCKLSGSFHKNPHHLEDDFILMITHVFYDDLFIHTKLAINEC